MRDRNISIRPGVRKLAGLEGQHFFRRLKISRAAGDLGVSRQARTVVGRNSAILSCNGRRVEHVDKQARSRADAGADARARRRVATGSVGTMRRQGTAPIFEFDIPPAVALVTEKLLQDGAGGHAPNAFRFPVPACATKLRPAQEVLDAQALFAAMTQLSIGSLPAHRAVARLARVSLIGRGIRYARFEEENPGRRDPALAPRQIHRPIARLPFRSRLMALTVKQD